MQDTLSEGGSEGDFEERIRRRADEIMAKLITQYGVTDADYAIRIGDTIIKGNSTRFIIKELSSMQYMVKSQADPIANITRAFAFGAMFFIAAVVAVILGIITSSNVKRQQKELGIMKSMGYTSKDLMTQTALRILPVTVVSVIIAAVVSVIINKYFWMLIFASAVDQNYVLTIGVSIAIVVFTYIFTYIGAGNIRKVSVTELMTE
ncbi:MAG: FtsX-like permease family protein [Oscillospiraceae bacterium]|nr:FtsX-like permease family protein [Oscillospiraceae bacterium]